jgi:ABC-type uncharacterized transport system substrate-binding protein
MRGRPTWSGAKNVGEMQLNIVQMMGRLTLGMCLIAVVSAGLLLSDWPRRSQWQAAGPRVAIVQLASQSVLDEGVQGILKGLEDNGFVAGETFDLQRYNAENDLATANAIAKEVVAQGYDLVLTASTISLQTVGHANATRGGKHVFGLVTDPVEAGIGISREDPLDHPPHMAGYGTFQPVGKAFRLARELYPGLRTVGVVWNPSEPNSAASTKQARLICEELGIALAEAAVDTSSGVFEAASSLVARGVQAIWVGGDVTVLLAFDAVVRAAHDGRIPVFTNTPPLAERGALFDLGANYFEVGRVTGVLGAQALKGLDLRTIPIANMVPERLVINQAALTGLRERWSVPSEVLAMADEIIDAAGAMQQRGARLAQSTPLPGRVYKLGVAYFAPEPGVDLTLKGLLEGLQEAGFTRDVNLEMRTMHAQGEIANLVPMLQSLDADGLDLIVPMTTPGLTAASTTLKQTPGVFVYVYDPIAAGVGRSFTDHLPMLTGVGSFPPLEDTVALIGHLVPGVRSVGTLYNSSEANSRKVISVARGLFAAQGITLEEVTVTNTSEVYQAASVLMARGIQALWITGDNTALQAFDGIVKVARDQQIPLIINDPEFIERGAVAAVGIGFYHSGKAAGRLAARVLLGEHPRTIAIENVAVKEVALNRALAGVLKVSIPSAVERMMAPPHEPVTASH